MSTHKFWPRKQLSGNSERENNLSGCSDPENNLSDFSDPENNLSGNSEPQTMCLVILNHKAFLRTRYRRSRAPFMSGNAGWQKRN